jgi:hypothetical protein
VTGATPAIYYEDVECFTQPFEAASDHCTRALGAATRTVKDAERRVAAALNDRKALEKFSKRVAELIRKRDFQSLPTLGPELAGYHQLTVGPWRGVFLVSADGAYVAGMLFTQAPHKLEPADLARLLAPTLPEHPTRKR